MAMIRIASSVLTDYTLLSSAGQPVVRTHQQLQEELRSSLSQSHAELLAKPAISERSQKIDWYTSNRATPLKELDDQARESAEARLAVLFDEIASHASELAARGLPQSSSLASFLELALKIPDLDSVYVQGDKPVLINWGTALRGQQAGIHPLKILAAEHSAAVDEAREPEITEPLGNSQVTDEQDDLAFTRHNGVLAEEKSEFWPSLVLGLVLFGIGFVIARLLLQSCAIALPSFSQNAGESMLWSTCENDSTYANRLEKLITAIQNDMQTANEACELPRPVEEPPVIEEQPTSQYLVRITPIDPAIGSYCLATICDSGLMFKKEESENNDEDLCVYGADIPSSVVTKIPPDSEDMCHLVLWPFESAEIAPTQFSGEVTLFINEEAVQEWPFEAVTPEQPLANLLKERGQYLSYYIGKFPFPHPTIER